MSIQGRWRITEMELWDRDTIDLFGPAFIEIGPGDRGRFRFIAVEGVMDLRDVLRHGVVGIEFTWEGDDECDVASGRGWATLSTDGSLTGRIFIHHGDDSDFRAVRAGDDAEPDRSVQRGSTSAHADDPDVRHRLVDEVRHHEPGGNFIGVELHPCCRSGVQTRRAVLDPVEEFSGECRLFNLVELVKVGLRRVGRENTPAHAERRWCPRWM